MTEQELTEQELQEERALLARDGARALLEGDFETWHLLSRLAACAFPSTRRWVQAVTESAFEQGYQFHQQQQEEQGLAA